MALPLNPTLAELRNRVAIRVGMATSGNMGSRMQPAIDESLRKAQRDIYLRFPWVRLWVRETYSTTTGVSEYDIPDTMHPGMLGRVMVLDTDSREYIIKNEDLVDLRNYYADADPGMPTCYRIIDQQIEVLPAPDATLYPTLVIEGQTRENGLVAATDRCSVDAEALVEYCTILFKEYMGIGGDTRLARMDFERNMIALRGLEAPSRSIGLASRNPDGPAYWDYPGIFPGYTPYTSTWTPW